jgi:hypothetical protein
MEDQGMEEKDMEKSLLNELVEGCFELRDCLVDGYFGLIKQIRCDHEKVIGDNLVCTNVYDGR